jgi:hypothetical protein
MRINRTFSIDIEIMEKLKGELNQSEIVNECLKNYFDTKEPKTLEELEKERLKLIAEIEYDKKIEEIENEFKNK